ncbi:MAG: shikimate kinase AroL [Desulfovibrio sp.]|nr:shikimate kinase AroL [Desulfovibrio sp.]
MGKSKNIFLIGPRASGKTTVAKILSEQLLCTYIDCDECFKNKFGIIADFISKNGWERFREEEHQILNEIILNKNIEEIQVIATGGGIILRKDNRELMKNSGIVVYLKTDERVLLERLLRQPLAGQRPSLTSKSLEKEVRQVLEERSPLYQDAANMTIDGNSAPALITKKILNVLGVRQEKKC